MGKAARRRRVFPSYIGQIMREMNQCWVDARKAAFDTLDEARDFLRDHLAHKVGRILVIEENERRPPRIAGRREDLRNG
jgi:hypothetical protein